MLAAFAVKLSFGFKNLSITEFPPGSLRSSPCGYVTDWMSHENPWHSIRDIRFCRCSCSGSPRNKKWTNASGGVLFLLCGVSSALLGVASQKAMDWTLQSTTKKTVSHTFLSKPERMEGPPCTVSKRKQGSRNKTATIWVSTRLGKKWVSASRSWRFCPAWQVAGIGQGGNWPLRKGLVYCRHHYKEGGTGWWSILKSSEAV